MPIIGDYCYERLSTTAIRTFSIHREKSDKKRENTKIPLTYSSHGEVFLPVFPERMGTAQIIFSTSVPVFMIM